MLDKLFNWGKSTNNKVSPKLQDIYMTLHKIKRNHSFVQVKFDADDAVYQSMIIDVDPDNNTLTIDELFPKDDGFLGMQGQGVTLTVRDRGVTISFSTEVIERGESGGVPLYMVRLPTTISKDQRRNAFRVDVDDRSDVRVQIDSEDHRHLLAKVTNLSATGVRFEVEGDQSELLCAGVVMHDCHIKLGEFGEVYCSVDIRNVQNFDEPHDHMSVGGRFVQISADQGRALEKFIASQQRKNLKGPSGEAA